MLIDEIEASSNQGNLAVRNYERKNGRVPVHCSKYRHDGKDSHLSNRLRPWARRSVR